MHANLSMDAANRQSTRDSASGASEPETAARACSTVESTGGRPNSGAACNGGSSGNDSFTNPRTRFAYFDKRSAQAFATALFGAVVPGAVAQPPFAMKSPRFHELAFIISAFCSPALAPFENESTQMGVRAVTTAVSAATLTASRCFPSVSSIRPTRSRSRRTGLRLQLRPSQHPMLYRSCCGP